MQEYFEKFIESISLTKTQRDDAITKYESICKCLNKEFYDSEYSDAVKFLFGSYKKKTTISHSNKDVDVIFKIPKDKFSEYQSQKNGPSNLLTKVKDTLKDTYSTTDNIKNWTKVVLVDFQSYKVEVLPALEQENGKFTIPNSGNGEDWITDFDPKKEIDDFFKSNNSNDKLTRKLIKIIKKWKLEKSTVSIKTYILDEYVITFLNKYTFSNYPKLVFDFFNYLHEKESQSYTETALNQSKKALDYYNSRKIDGAIEEYKKLFGDSFPKNINKSIDNTQYQVAPNEEFIENIMTVSINEDVVLDIKIYCKPKKGGFMHRLLLEAFPSFGILKQETLEFDATVKNLTGQYETMWKVRNFGDEAEKNSKLRGEIINDNNGLHKYKDSTAFYGEHFLECYVIQNNFCVARKRITIPVNLI